jgi:hypothetical protein
MHTDAARNIEATGRLRELVAALSDADLAAPLGGGWMVAMALGHLAFWDVRQRAALQYFIDTGVLIGDELPAPHNPDLTNPALEPLLALLDHGGLPALVVEAARAVDETVAGLEDRAIEGILGGEHAYVARRWAHREEHITQIQGATSPA